MNAEQSRSPEIHLPVFALPRNLTKDKAVNIFNTLYRPQTFVLTEYKYNPHNGTFAAIGHEKAQSF